MRVLPAHQQTLDTERQTGALACTSQLAASAGYDGITRVWNLAHGSLMFELHGNSNDHVQCVGFLPDGKRLVTGSASGAVTVWSLADGHAITHQTIAAGGTCVLAIDVRGTMFVGKDRALAMWTDPEQAAVATVVAHTGTISTIELSKDQAMVMTSSEDGTARIWSTAKLDLLDELAARSAVRAAHFDATGQHVVTATADNLFRIWDVATKLELFSIEAATAAGGGHFAAGAFTAWFDDMNHTVLLGSGIDVHAWLMDNAPMLEHRTTPASMLSVRWSPREDALLETGTRHAEIQRGGASVPLAIPPTNIWDGTWSPDGRQVLLVGELGFAAIYTANGPLEHRLVGHTGAVNHGSFSPDGSRLLTTSSDHHVMVWEVATGLPVRDFVLDSPIVAASWAHDNARLVIADYAGGIGVWDARTGVKLQQLSDPASQFLDVAFSPDDTQLVTAGHDGLVTIWDLATSARRKLVGHTGPCTTVSWSPDGALLASGAELGGIRIWDAVTGREIGRRDRGAGHMSVEWSRDGTRILAASLEGGYFIWDAHRDAHSLVELDVLEAKGSWRLLDGHLVPR